MEGVLPRSSAGGGASRRRHRREARRRRENEQRYGHRVPELAYVAVELRSREQFYGRMIWVVNGPSFRATLDKLPDPKSEFAQDLCLAAGKSNGAVESSGVG